MHADGSIGVVLLDDLQLMRIALKALRLQDRRISLLGDTSDAQECVTLAVQRGAQMVIVNADVRDGAALTALHAVEQHAPTALVLVLGDGEDGGARALLGRRRRIHDKLGLRHRSEFVQLAMAAGLLVE